MSSAASPNRTGEAREARELRLRARNIGIDIDTFRPGRYGAITDVNGVKVSHCTLVEGEEILLPCPVSP